MTGRSLVVKIVLRMVVVALAGFGALLAGGSPAGAQGEPEAQPEGSGGPAPRVEVAEPVYEFGEVFRGNVVKHSFRLKNAGDADLVIRDVEKDCQCTVARVEKTRIKPGEEIGINARLNTAQLEGEVDRQVRLSTNDPGEPETILTFHGRVLITTNIEPRKVHVKGYRPGDEIPEQIVRLEPVEGYDLKVEKVEAKSKSKLISARLLEPDDTGAPRIGISISSKTENSVETGTVLVHTNLVEEPVLRIPVKVVITQPYEVSPLTVSFTNIRPDFEGPLGYRITVVNNEIEPLVIEDIRSSSKYLEYQVMTVEEGQEYRIKLIVMPGFPEEGFTDQVTIVTNNEMYPEKVITVKVTGPQRGKARKKDKSGG
jgi:hypothetical protein